MTPGSRKVAGGFWIARQAALKTALFVEGAIDALSAWTLDEEARIDIVISTAGATGRVPEWINRFELDVVFCGYDADQAGDLAVTMLERLDPAVRRMRPVGDGDVKDWNGILTRREKTTTNLPPGRNSDGSREPSSQTSAKREEPSRTERNNAGDPRRSNPKNNNREVPGRNCGDRRFVRPAPGRKMPAFPCPDPSVRGSHESWSEFVAKLEDIDRTLVDIAPGGKSYRSDRAGYEVNWRNITRRCLRRVPGDMENSIRRRCSGKGPCPSGKTGIQGLADTIMGGGLPADDKLLGEAGFFCRRFRISRRFATMSCLGGRTVRPAAETKLRNARLFPGRYASCMSEAVRIARSGSASGQPQIRRNEIKALQHDTCVQE